MNQKDYFKKIAEDIRKRMQTDISLTEERKNNLKEAAEGFERIVDENIYKIHTPDEWAELLKNESLKFFMESDKYYHEERHYGNENPIDYFFHDKVSRIFLAVACETMLKAAFLLKGYCIHEVKDKGFLLKFEDIDIANEVLTGRTARLGMLIENLDLVFDDEAESEEIKQLEDYLGLVRDWRNNDIHLGLRHAESLEFRHYIKICFNKLQSKVESLQKQKAEQVKQ